MKHRLSLVLLLFAPAVCHGAITDFPNHAGARPFSGDLVRDGGFEAGSAPTYWVQSSIHFGTPICNAECGGQGPRTGTHWAWFGGNSAAEEASLEQAGTIAAEMDTLNFYVWWTTSVISPPDPNALFNVKIDGTTVFTLTPATAAPYSTGYTVASANISAHADGNVHTLRFEISTADSFASTSLYIDDVEIVDNLGELIFAAGFE